MMENVNFTHVLTQAQTSLDASQLNDSIVLCNQILDTIPAKTTAPEQKQSRLNALRIRGTALINCHMPTAAIADFETWRAESESDTELVDIMLLQVRAQATLGQYDDAYALCHEALDMARANNADPVQIARVYRARGILAINSGRYDHAISHYNKALGFLDQEDDPALRCIILNGLGIAYDYILAFDKAIAAYEKILALSDPIENSRIIAMSLNNLGETYQTLFDLDEALAYHQQALTTLTDDDKSHNPWLLCDVFRNIGVDLCELGRIEEGIEYLNRAQRTNIVGKNSDVTMQFLHSFAKAYLQNGDIEKAIQMAEECIALAREGKARHHQAQAAYILGLCEQAQGDLVAAHDAWQRAIYLAHETRQRSLLWRVHYAMAESMTDKETAVVHQDIALDIIEKLADVIEDDTIRGKFLATPQIQAVRNLNA